MSASELLTSLYGSGSNESFEGDARLQFLQRQVNDLPVEPTLMSQFANRLSEFLYEFHRELSVVGSLPPSQLPSRLSMFMGRGDNMAICGMALILLGLVALAFDTRKPDDCVRIDARNALAVQ